MANLQERIEQARQVDLARLPPWYGEPGKDTFDAHQYIHRIELAKESAHWDDASTMAFVFHALRSKALLWFDALKRSGVDAKNWTAYRRAFLDAYSITCTSRTATINLADLHQSPAENVVDFYSKVVKAVDQLETLVPAGGFPLPATPFPAAFAAIAAADKLAAATALHTAGATAAFNHVAMQLFISNLRPALRDEIMKSPPVSLYETFQTALRLEHIQADPKKAALSTAKADVSAVVEQPKEDIDAEIDALSEQLRKKFQQRGSTFRGFPPRGGRGRAPQRGSPAYRGSSAPPAHHPSGNNPAKLPCRYCNRTSHLQKTCNDRKRAGAPMVDAQGIPYRSEVHQVDETQPAAPPASAAPPSPAPMHPAAAEHDFYSGPYYAQDFQ